MFSEEFEEEYRKFDGEDLGKELQIEASQISEKARKLRARWTPMTEEEKEACMPDMSSMDVMAQMLMNQYHHGYPDDQPTMGFFMWGEVDPELVKKEYPGIMNAETKSIVLEYMGAATKETGYMGMASSRIDGSFLGSHDMRTPDGKWIFPEQWDTHYVEKYDICPTQEFVDDAIKWKEENDC